MENKLWMRKIRVTLTSQLPYENGQYGKMVFGDEDTNNITSPNKLKLCPLSISIQGKKTAATLQDNGVVVITNLGYETIAKITLYKFFTIRIEIGYENNNFVEIFNGGVSFISQKIHSRHDTETYITYASHLVAAYSQQRINFTINSGVNLYACLQQIAAKAGMPQLKISQDLKNEVFKEAESLSGSAGTLIEKVVANTTGNYTLSTDGTNGTVVDLTSLNDKRVIVIDNKDIPIKSGNPTLSSSGVDITLLPTFNFKVGDILKLDNAMLNMSISNADQVTSTFNSNYLDKNGLYMIYYMNYYFENRGDSFEYKIKARALDVISGITGGY